MKTHCIFIGNSILIYIVYVSFLYPMKWFVGDFYKIDVKIFVPKSIIKRIVPNRASICQSNLFLILWEKFKYNILIKIWLH